MTVKNYRDQTMEESDQLIILTDQLSSIVGASHKTSNRKVKKTLYTRKTAKIRAFRCNVNKCRVTCKSEERLKIHIQNLHGFKCNVCDEWFKIKHENTHRVQCEHFDLENGKCMQCGVDFHQSDFHQSDIVAQSTRIH